MCLAHRRSRKNRCDESRGDKNNWRCRHGDFPVSISRAVSIARPATSGTADEHSISEHSISSEKARPRGIAVPQSLLDAHNSSNDGFHPTWSNQIDVEGRLWGNTCRLAAPGAPAARRRIPDLPRPCPGTLNGEVQRFDRSANSAQVGSPSIEHGLVRDCTERCRHRAGPRPLPAAQCQHIDNLLGARELSGRRRYFRRAEHGDQIDAHPAAPRPSGDGRE